MSGEILIKEGLNDSALTDVISTIWSEYSVIGSSELEQKKMNLMIIESEKSYYVAAPLHGYIIVFICSNMEPLGLIKSYLEQMSSKLFNLFSPFEGLIRDK